MAATRLAKRERVPVDAPRQRDPQEYKEGRHQEESAQCQGGTRTQGEQTAAPHPQAENRGEQKNLKETTQPPSATSSGRGVRVVLVAAAGVGKGDRTVEAPAQVAVEKDSTEEEQDRKKDAKLEVGVEKQSGVGGGQAEADRRGGGRGGGGVGGGGVGGGGEAGGGRHFIDFVGWICRVDEFSTWYCSLHLKEIFFRLKKFSKNFVPIENY